MAVRADEQPTTVRPTFLSAAPARYCIKERGTTMIELLASIMLSGPGIGCTYEHPQPVGINEICTGLGYPGSSCKVVYGSNCSPIPGMPGTWNPSGYTPKIG